MLEISVPRYTLSEIHKKADEFRANNCNEGLPVDVHSTVEFSLGWSIEAVKGLQLIIGVDSFINSTFTTVFVDSDNFVEDRYLDRMRFSLAHEIGHFVLHSAFFMSQKIEKVSDFVTFYESISESDYNRLEKDADEFAGRLLVPCDRLHSSVGRAKRKMSDINIPQTPNSVIAGYMANDISKEFQVSCDVIEIRIRKERLL